MRHICLTLVFALTTSLVFAQPKEELLDFHFSPTRFSPYYYATTEKKGDLYYREAWFVKEKSMAMKGWYKDDGCTVAMGNVTRFHPNKTLRSTGAYVDGKKNGLWLYYHDNGMIQDSANYVMGRKKGVSFGWDKDGYPTDSTNFDGAGNGVEIRWYPNGTVSSAGRWTADTVKTGSWNFYHQNGMRMATENYNNNELTSKTCFDETGTPLPKELCLDKEADLSENENAWIAFISKTLNPEVPFRKNAPVGEYTVLVQFVVDTDGKLIDIEPLTSLGFGMEAEVMRVLRKSPKWMPAYQHGKKVKAYRRQPITFTVQQE